MQSPLSRNYQCEKHNEQKVMFVCAVNDWHFEPLCQLCTPGHIQNHAKRLKINLQSFEQINKKVMGRQEKVRESYSEQLERVKQLLSDKKYEELVIIKELKTMQDKIVEKIRGYFSELNQKITQKLKLSLSQNTGKLNALSSNLQNQISCIKQISTAQLSLQKWRNSAKKIYFEDKLQSYLEESKEILQQYEQKNTQITSVKRKQLFTDEQKFFISIDTLINSQVKSLIGDCFAEQKGKNIKGKQKDVKKPTLQKKPIVKPKRKTCKNCNQQMQYLTENKKHLVCRYCNFKERNYIKKPI